MNDFYFDTIMETMPEYYSTETHMCIRTKDRLIEIPFPKKRWELYQNKYKFTGLDEMPFKTMQSIYLQSYRDFRMGELAIEDISAISHKLREYLRDHPSKQALDDVLAKCSQFAYLVRVIPKNKSEAKKFNSHYNDTFEYFKKYGTNAVRDYDDICTGQNKIMIKGRPLYSEFFQESKDQNNEEKNFIFEQQQKGVLLLIRDFLSGKIFTDELSGAIPAITWEKLISPKNTREKKLESLFSRLDEATFYIRNFGYASAFTEAIIYYEENKAEIESVSSSNLKSESYNSTRTVTKVHTPVPDLEKFLFRDSKKIDT